MNPNSFPSPVDEVIDRLPRGTIELGAQWLRAGGYMGGEANSADFNNAVRDQITAPLRLVTDWPEPTDPMTVAGGAVHYDLISEDLETLATLRHQWNEIVSHDPSTDNCDLNPETLAAYAQTWRLCVTPYRPLEPARRLEGLHPSQLAAPGPTPSAGRPRPLVVDLSALWAGPLATRLLCDHNIDVIKVNPSCRLDGFGVHDQLFEHLNGPKSTVDLDLRTSADRARFEEMVRNADLVIDSFSRRVMPNLGYAPQDLRRLNPTVATMSIVGFGAGRPESHWVSYGPGVHAISGLADLDRSRSGRWRPSPIAYPDVLAGLAAFAFAQQVVRLNRTNRAATLHHEIGLDQVLAPLVDIALETL